MILDKVIQLLVLSLLFLTPLIPASFNRGYEEVKVLTLLYGTIAAAFLVGIKSIRKKIKLRMNKIVGIQIVFIFAFLIASLSGINSTQSLLGAPPYFQGWVTFLFLTVLGIIIVIERIPPQKTTNALIFSAAIVGCYAIIQWLQLQQGLFAPTYAGRVVSTFGQPNFYAGFLLLVMPLILERISQTKRIEKIIILACLAVNTTGIAASFSRTAIILCAIVLSMWLILKVVKTRLLKVILFVLVTCGIFYALIPSKILEDELIRPLASQTVEFSNVQKRVYIWQISIEQILKRPLIGYGPENINEALPSNYDFNHPKPAFYHSIKDLNIDNTHNIFLNLLLWGGVLLLIPFLLFNGLLFKLAQNNYQKVALLIFLIWAFFQNLSLIHWLFLYVLAVLISSKAEESIDRKKAKPVH